MASMGTESLYQNAQRALPQICHALMHVANYTLTVFSCLIALPAKQPGTCQFPSKGPGIGRTTCLDIVRTRGDPNANAAAGGASTMTTKLYLPPGLSENSPK